MKPENYYLWSGLHVSDSKLISTWSFMFVWSAWDAVRIIMMMMMNCFYWMIVTDSRHRTNTPNTPRTAFEQAQQNLSSGFVEWSCAVVIIALPRRHFEIKLTQCRHNSCWHEFLNWSYVGAIQWSFVFYKLLFLKLRFKVQFILSNSHQRCFEK